MCTIIFKLLFLEENGGGSKHEKEEERGGLSCMGREGMFKGPGEENILTEPDGSKRRDCSDLDQTSIRN